MSNFLISDEQTLTEDLLPVLIKTRYNITGIEITPEDKRLVLEARDPRLLFCFNHPTSAEPPLTYALGVELGLDFKYVTPFEQVAGLRGEVSPGSHRFQDRPPGREFIQAFLKLQSEEKVRLVAFPEGGITSGENDFLMPYQESLFRIALRDLRDSSEGEPGADFGIVPGFIKYVIRAEDNEIKNYLLWSLQKLEDKSGLKSGQGNLLERFLEFGKNLLELTEREYGISTGAEGDFDERVERIRHVILDRAAETLDARDYPADADAITKLHRLQIFMGSLMMHSQEQGVWREHPGEVHRELMKTYNFIAIHSGYLRENPTPERFFEWLTRFESHLLEKRPRELGGEPFHLPTQAYVLFGAPFRLSQYYERAGSNRKKAATDAVRRLRKETLTLMERARGLSQALVLESGS